MCHLFKICQLLHKLNHVPFEFLANPKQSPYLPYPKAYLEYKQTNIQTCVLTSSLCILTEFTILHIPFYFSSHLRPEIKLFQLPISLVYTKMSYKSTTMFFLDQIFSHKEIWYAQLISFK